MCYRTNNIPFSYNFEDEIRHVFPTIQGSFGCIFHEPPVQTSETLETTKRKEP